MYAWLWRRLPFGLPGKLIGVIGLGVATVALLWYVVFPWAEPILPFDDVQVSTEDGVPGGADLGTVPDGADGSAGAGDGHDTPYSTESNNPVPSTRSGR